MNKAERLEELKSELIEEKLRFTKLWVDHMISSANKDWSSEQKRFIDALFENYRKNKLLDSGLQKAI